MTAMQDDILRSLRFRVIRCRQLYPQCVFW